MEEGRNEKPVGERYAAASVECFGKPVRGRDAVGCWLGSSGLLAITVGFNPVMRPLTAGRVIGGPAQPGMW
jgi:hypothetical protein